MSTYRDELAAAHERIAELEAQLAVRDGEAEAWLAKLAENRARIVAQIHAGMSRADAALLAIMTILFVFAVPLGLAQLVGWSPFEPAVAGVMALVVWLTHVTSRAARRDAAKRSLRAMDERIEDVRRMVAIAAGRQREARIAADSQLVRVAAESAVEDDLDVEETSRRVRRA